MTREEAIEELERLLRHWDLIDEGIYDLSEHDQDAVEIALTALRPVSREWVEKGGMGCKYCDEEWGTCNPITNRFVMPPRGGIQYCPMCGKPLTDEAVDMVMERMEALHENRD